MTPAAATGRMAPACRSPSPRSAVPPRRACRRIPGRTCWYSAKPACWWKGALERGPLDPDVRIETGPSGKSWRVQAYIPQRDAALPLIEQWTALDDQVSHWRVVSGDNIESLLWRQRLGPDPRSGGSWPDIPMAAGRGGRRQGQPRPIPLQDRRRRRDRRYQPIYRENPATATIFPLRKPTRPTPTNWCSTMASTRWTDCRAPAPIPMPARAWTERPDPFSSFRSGFEIRTRRLCRGVLTFLNFPTELGALPCLNASVRFGYAESPYLSCLSTLLSTGCSRLADGAYEELSVPPMRWGFSAFNPPPAPRRAAAGAGRDRPARLPGARRLPARGPARRRPPGFLQSDGVVTRYYEPLGDGRWRADGAGALSRQRQPGRSRAGPGRPGQQWPAGAAGIRQRHGLLPAWRRWRLERPPAVRRHPHPCTAPARPRRWT